LHGSARVGLLAIVGSAAALGPLAGCRSRQPEPREVSSASAPPEPALRNPSDEPPPQDIAFLWGGETSRLCLLARGSAQPQILAEDVWPAVPPAWSPEGDHIAFCVEEDGGRRQLETIGLAGRRSHSPAPELAVGPAVTWSPDGAHLAMIGEREDKTGIWVVPPAGAGVQLVLPLAAERCPWVGWSPVGDELAFLWVQNEGGVECDLKVVSADGSDERVINPSIPASATARPSWSPDGTRIAFTSAEGDEEIRVCVADVALGEARALMATLTTIPDPVWAPDGTRLCFDYAEATEGFDHAPDSGELWAVLASVEIYAVAVESGEGKAITDNNYSESDLAWSPDGKAIAAVASREGGTKRQLRLVDVNTGSSRAVVEADMPEAGRVPPDVEEHGLLLRPRWRP